MISLGSRLIACCKLAPTSARKMWRHNYVIDSNEYLIFTLSESVNPWVYSLQFLFKSINNSWRYERKCEWVFFFWTQCIHCWKVQGQALSFIISPHWWLAPRTTNCISWSAIVWRSSSSSCGSHTGITVVCKACESHTCIRIWWSGHSARSPWPGMSHKWSKTSGPVNSMTSYGGLSGGHQHQLWKNWPPVGLSRNDGKHPDVVTLLPWAKGKQLKVKSRWFISRFYAIRKSPQNRSTIPPCSLYPMPLPKIRRF